MRCCYRRHRRKPLSLLIPLSLNLLYALISTLPSCASASPLLSSKTVTNNINDISSSYSPLVSAFSTFFRPRKSTKHHHYSQHQKSLSILSNTNSTNNIAFKDETFINGNDQGDSVNNLSPPQDVIRMIALPPRDLIPGSTKGTSFKVRLLNSRRRRRLMSNNNNEELENEHHENHVKINSETSHSNYNTKIMKWVRRNLLSFESFTSTSKTSILNQDKDIYKVDLHGGIVGVGEYFSYIEIGGKKIRVQIDTGSSTLAVPMKGCSSCINKLNRYNVDESYKGKTILCDSDECASDRCTTNCVICSERGACCSTERPNECGFSLRYADGSAASGSVVRDEMKWGKLKINVTFGGILENSPNFERPEVDGILGMAFKNLACNPSCFNPPFDELVINNLVKDIFSICMTNVGGKLMLGGIDKNVILKNNKIHYVKLKHLNNEHRYYRIALNGKLGINHNKFISLPDFNTAIVDTGTTLIVTSTRAFNAIKAYLQKSFCNVPELCHADSWFQSGMCVNLSDDDLSLLPTFTFILDNNIQLHLRPQDYMLSYKRGKRQYRCVGIMGMDGLGGMVVLGNTLMQRYVTVYDRKGGRIGFGLAAPRCGE